MPSALDRLRQAQQPPAAPQRRRGGIIGAIAAGLLLVVVKTKGAILIALSKLDVLLGGLKLAKLGTMAWTMLAMAGAYALFYGWRFAVGLVALLLVHELGHAAAARAVGVPFRAPVFIPFVGAFIALRGTPRTAWHEVVIAAGGPVIGGAAAALCLAVGAAGGDGLWLGLGYVGLSLNLFNLTPVWQLDGARMLASVGWRAGAVGVGAALVALIAIAITTAHVHPIPFLALVIAGWRFAARWRAERRTRPRSALEALAASTRARAAAAQAPIEPGQERAAIALYVATLLALAGLVHALHAAVASAAPV